MLGYHEMYFKSSVQHVLRKASNESYQSSYQTHFLTHVLCSSMYTNISFKIFITRRIYCLLSDDGLKKITEVYFFPHHSCAWENFNLIWTWSKTFDSNAIQSSYQLPALKFWLKRQPAHVSSHSLSSFWLWDLDTFKCS